MHFYNGYHFWGMHLIWWIIWLIVIIAAIALGKSFFMTQRHEDSPLDILQKRFAAGEISKEEYEARKAILERERQS